MQHVVDDCWNKIGVRGDSSCKTLAQVAHCRNCRVYSSTAANLLDGEPPADYIAHWTEQTRRPKNAAQRESLSVLIFRLAAEWLALPTKALTEIASERRIHSLPHRRNGIVLGLANIRGELVVCISLREILNVDAAIELDASDRTRARMLVVHRDGLRAVCPVDEVHGVERVFANELGSMPATVVGAATKHTRATLTWKERTVGLIDEQALFHTVNRSVA